MRWFSYCFLTNIFQITFKYLQNIVICFHLVKYPWEKYNMLRADEDCWMLFLHNELLVYISNANRTEKPHKFWTKISNFVKFNHKNHCCNLSLNIMMKRWKHSMASILNCRAIFFSIQERVEKLLRGLQLQSIGGLFQ